MTEALAGLSSEEFHKEYSRIPITECGEALIEIPVRFPRLLPHPYVAAGAPYADSSPWFLRSGVVAALKEAQSVLEERNPGWSIAIFDAWRPLAVQAFMVWRQFIDEASTLDVGTRELAGACNDPMELRSRHPELYADLAARVYRFWGIANPDPSHPPPHSTGAALDCTLLDEQGAPVPMGGPVDDFSDRASPDYFANAQMTSAEAQFHHHRKILQRALCQRGFVQHPGEWWHFSLGDQFWAWRTRAAYARYGRVDSPRKNAPQ
ncbi:M15 family metallopeptidase [Acidithiobacillus sp. CV18-2]|uniref:D-alanyl-D-alanine dipeptidase n=1 Tax=Igneacidithiobacillus copahuensis TaxID=2724909 RepID=A0AAE2YMB4_9PROT|nr:M15 family metallopeptidase [Igneacidithiobacillus copahuensis]MBU2754822.1 M15 family metallopeptidase [Acidithiobacillus sp. CV18-3]MBU2757460.1 M15 family metallopeptidase [Acidithiobacillus sp. BN09-2]MBU2776491.1 M15 family metallopeptidase [Acidithiobacillus sp. CV18-2]MBU2795327.1 M15 family metallopeptidase [Acidithiobacillus sp. VAN18-2]MBU2798395.1 M15 family metallopeptidase [Acidithiobacillus sp. VAN18-4]UTV80289.1 peptidase M15 [Acidithiobacillus sp. YTS05]